MIDKEITKWMQEDGLLAGASYVTSPMMICDVVEIIKEVFEEESLEKLVETTFKYGPNEVFLHEDYLLNYLQTHEFSRVCIKLVPHYSCVDTMWTFEIMDVDTHFQLRWWMNYSERENAFVSLLVYSKELYYGKED